MPKGSDNPFPSVLIVEQGSTPSSPAAGDQRLFIDSASHALKTVDSSGTVTTYGSGGGTVTHTGTLTSGKTIIGNGSADITVSSLTASVVSSSSGTLAAASTTGSGNVVLATSPTLVTPALGTPASGTLTSCTGLPTAGLVNAAVTLAKIQNATANSVLIGSGASGSGASYSEIALGSGLSMSGTTLSATDAFWTTVTAASDLSRNSTTTPTTDSELFFTMTAAKLYLWVLYLIYSSPAGAGTPDMKLQFTGPATFTGAGTYLSYVTTADAFNGAIGQQDINTAPFLTPGTAATPRMACVEGWAYSTAGGTGSSGFQVQWAQNTSSANATVRLAGSCLLYRQLSA